MTEARPHYPWVVPAFLAFVAATTVFLLPYIEASPSSTSAIAFFVVPFAAAAVGVATFGLTLGAAVVLQRWSVPRKLLRAPVPLLLASPLVGAALAYTVSAWSALRLSPHVVRTSERVQRLTSASSCPVVNIEPARFMPGPGAHNGIDIPFALMHLSMPSASQLRVDCTRGGGDTQSFSFPDDITFVRAWPLGSGSAEPIVLAIDLRATSRTSVLIILTPMGEVLHWEVVNRPQAVVNVEMRFANCLDSRMAFVSAIGGPDLGVSPADKGP